MRRVRTEHVAIPSYLSRDCRDFLALLFERDKTQRVGFAQLQTHRWWTRTHCKLQRLQLTKIQSVRTRRLRDWHRRITVKKEHCRYEVRGGVATLSWGGTDADDSTMTVNSKARHGRDASMSISIVFGGIKSQTYSLATLPIGFRAKYRLLTRFVALHSRNAPMIAVSMHNQSHYAVLTHSRDVHYYHFRAELGEAGAQIFIQYSEHRDEYFGDCKDLKTEEKTTFNVLQSELYADDVSLFRYL